MFPAMIIVPLMQICWTLFSIVSGMLYFQEYKGFTTLKAIMFSVGVLVSPATRPAARPPARARPCLQGLPACLPAGSAWLDAVQQPAGQGQGLGPMLHDLTGFANWSMTVLPRALCPQRSTHRPLVPCPCACPCVCRSCLWASSC